MNRTALLALALSAGFSATFSAPALARIPTEMPLSGRVEATGSRGYATVVSTLAYAAPAASVAAARARPDEATAREEEPPAPRKTCPTRSWPNLAPRCVAALETGR
jgi:hypothetical protein